MPRGVLVVMLLLYGSIGQVKTPLPPRIVGTLRDLQNMEHVDHFNMFITMI
jgi:hypothetical protein